MPIVFGQCRPTGSRRLGAAPRFRRLASLAVLVVAALASLATSPGQPMISNTLVGHTEVAAGRSATHELQIRVDAPVADRIDDVMIQFGAGNQLLRSQYSAVEVRLRGPGVSEDTAGWQDTFGSWSLGDLGCTAGEECVRRYGLDVRRGDGIARALLLGWDARVTVRFEYGAVGVRHDSVRVATTAERGWNLLAWAYAGVSGGIAAAVLVMVALGRLRGRAAALRWLEAVVGVAMAVAGAWVVARASPGLGVSSIAVLFIPLSVLILTVAWYRPPGGTPRATAAATALALVPISLSAYVTASAVEPIAVFLTFAVLGGLLTAGTLGLLIPTGWWARLLQERRARAVSGLAGVLVLLLGGCALIGAAGGVGQTYVFVPLAALLAVWLLLAYRDWTESRSRLLRYSALAVALGGVLVTLATAFGPDRLLSFGTSPPLPLTPFVAFAVAILAAALAKAALPAPAKPVAMPQPHEAGPPPPEPPPVQLDRRATLQATGFRAVGVVTLSVLLISLLGLWTVLVITGLTPYPALVGAVPFAIVLALGLGLWRWLGAGSGLLRFASVAGGLFTILTGLTLIYSSNQPLWDFRSIVQLGQLVALVSALLLFALGSAPGVRRDGIDWTA